MAFYASPKSRADAQKWIDWNVTNYATFGFGLWIVETHSGEFVGDCGLTWQLVDGRRELEVGYHVRHDLQGRRIRDRGRAGLPRLRRWQLGEPHLVAIIHPDNVASQRVAEKIGLTLESTSTDSLGQQRSVFGTTL